MISGQARHTGGFRNHSAPAAQPRRRSPPPTPPARPTGTSVLPAEGNRHKAAAHTMAGICTRRCLQPSPPRSCTHF